MRIAFVTNNYTPYSGGLTSSINAITDALRMQGHQVFIITLDFLDKKEAIADPDYVIRVACPIKFMYKKNYMAIPWRPTHAITQLLKQYKPDIVHVHHPFLLGVSALHAARTLKIPCVFTYHTMYEQYAHYIPLPKFCTKPLIRSTVRRFCNAVDGIIVPSSAVRNYLLAQKITVPIKIIPSPLRTIFFTNITKIIKPDRSSPIRARPDASTLLSSEHPPALRSLGEGRVEGYLRALEDNQFDLLVVSRFVPEKNIPFVFDVFKQLPNTFTLTLVGYGTDYEKTQKRAFDTLQLSPKRVHFIHKPDPDNLIKLYRNADLFIFPSQTDTQGLVLAEAMSQGLPVIALDGPGQRDIINNGINGFIIENADHAAATIINIANNAELHKKLSAGARATAQHYHTDSIIKQLLNFYHATKT